MDLEGIEGKEPGNLRRRIGSNFMLTYGRNIDRLEALQ